MNGKTIAFNLRNGVKYDENGITTATKAFIDALADIIEELEKAIEEKQMRIENMEADAPRWYPASMKPEKDDEDYYVLTENDGIIPLRFLDGEWGIFAECFVGDACSGEEWVGIEKLKINFSYWMPIPKPPKGGEHE